MTATRRKFLNDLINDIKRNGVCYLKSEVVVKEIKSLDKNVHVIYNKEERTYIARYSKAKD